MLVVLTVGLKNPLNFRRFQARRYMGKGLVQVLLFLVGLLAGACLIGADLFAAGSAENTALQSLLGPVVDMQYAALQAPEPVTLILVGTGLLGIEVLRRRTKK
jgi:hypothetical protein